MKNVNENEFIWTQKYRPQKIEDCILPKETKQFFENILKQGSFQSLLLAGTAGSGKTTVAIALCKELGLDYLLINASDESGIDVLRGKIKQFASTVSVFSGEDEKKHKVVILDEAEYLTAQNQAALRGVVEQFSSMCSFILTCNYKNRIIPALHSRSVVIDFNVADLKQPEILGAFHKRIISILDNEEVQYDKKTVADVIMKWAPDFRRIINELQKFSVQNSNVIDESLLFKHGSIQVDIKKLINTLKDKNFKEMREWVVEHSDIDSSELFKKIYDAAFTAAVPVSIPKIVLILAEYQYRAAFVVDQEINTVAAMTEIMQGCEFK